MRLCIMRSPKSPLRSRTTSEQDSQSRHRARLSMTERAQTEDDALMRAAALVTILLVGAATTVAGGAAAPAAAASAPADAHVIFGRMTEAQRIGQLFMVGAAATGVSDATRAAITTYHVGNVILPGRSSLGVSATRSITDGL